MAHVYLTLVELDARLKGDALVKADAPMKTEELERAAHEADGYLRRGGYTVPLPTGADKPIDEALKGALFDIVNYRLHLNLGYLEADVTKTGQYIAYRDAMAYLKAIATGEVELEIVDQDPGDEPTGGAVVLSRPSRGWL